MITQSPPRRRLTALVTAVAVAAVGLSLPAAPAAAADGPAPAPAEHRLVAGVHTDAVSTFLDDGALVLGSKADVAEGNGTRLDPATTRLHLEQEAATQVPAAGFEFLGEAGAPVWIAPQSNPGPGRLWPGFSTESVAAGGVAEDRTTFTLTGVQGPGDLELFSTGGFGQVQRLWSSDEPGLTTFEVGRTHMHANWAFTAAGTYRVGVRAAATVAGAPQTADATYTFVVGDVPAPVATTTTVTPSATSVVLGEPVTLAASVAPADVEGYLELRAGERVLGHERVAGGAASLTVPDLGVGRHAVTAVFVPALAHEAASSTSDAVDVVVTEEAGGEEFGLTGVAASYAPGDVLRARVAGVTLTDGQNVQWRIRPVGVTDAGGSIRGDDADGAAAGRLTLPVDVLLDGYEISARLRSGNATLQQTPWVPVAVADAVEAPTAQLDVPTPVWKPDVPRVAVGGRPLAAGEELRLVARERYGWSEVSTQVVVDPTRIDVLNTYPQAVDWAVAVVRDGVAVARSASFPADVRNREVQITGTQGVYRVGDVLRAVGDVYPARDDLTYVWVFGKDLGDEGFLWEEVQRGTGAQALTYETTVEERHDGGSLYLDVIAPGEGEEFHRGVGSTNVPLTVTTAGPGEQLLFFRSLGDHYHQGYDVDLQLVADPGLADGDTIEWQWRWPGQDWTTLPGASGLRHRLVAEQAMHGVEVRAALVVPGAQPVTAEPVTVRVDDHGSPASQIVTVQGAADAYRPGQQVELAAQVDPTSVLDTYQWFARAPGAAQAEPVAGATGATWAFTADAALHGTQVSVAVVAPGGAVAYGPSRPVPLAVAGDALPTVVVTGLAGHYHSGDAITLGAVATPSAADDVFRWSVQRVDQVAPVVVAGEGAALTLTAEQALHGARVSVERLVDDQVVATSPVRTIDVDDHGHAPAQRVTVAGLAERYGVGDEVALDASVAPVSVLDRWEWYVQRAGQDTPALVEDADGARLRFLAAADLDGAALFARLTFDDGTPYVESAPVLLAVGAGTTPTPTPTDPGTTPEPTPTPTDPGTTPAPEPTDPGAEPAPSARPGQPPVARSGAELRGEPGGLVLGAQQVRQGEVLTIGLGTAHADAWVAAWLFSTPTLLGGDWLQASAAGDVAVRVPADATPGQHRVAVFAADGTLVGWQSVTVLAADGSTPTTALAATGGVPVGAWALLGLLLVGAGGALVVRRRTALRQG